MRQAFLLYPVSIHKFLSQNCCISQQRDTPFVKNKVRCMALYTHLLLFFKNGTKISYIFYEIHSVKGEAL